MKHARHRLLATRTDGKSFWFDRLGRWLICSSDLKGNAGVEGDAMSFGFGRWMTVAIMTNGLESPGQHMTQIATNKLHALDCFRLLDATMLAAFPGEGVMGDGDRPSA